MSLNYTVQLLPKSGINNCAPKSAHERRESSGNRMVVFNINKYIILYTNSNNLKWAKNVKKKGL